MISNKRVQLLAAAKAADVDKLADIVGKTKADQNEMADVIAEFSKSQMDEFWQSIYSIGTSFLLKEQDGEQSEEDEESIHTLLKCASSLALSTLTALQMSRSSEEDCPSIETPRALQEVTMVLHGIFPTLNEKWQPLKNQMCRLFENWWIQQLDGKEEIVVNTITYLLARCTEPNSSQSDIVRIWAIHAMLELVDFKASSADSLVFLLQRTCHHPQFISNVQGLKFLAFVLTLNPDLTSTLHQTIKNHLASTPKSWHAKYGEVYLRAWQKSSDDMRQKLEEDCIQDLMYRAVHAYRRGIHSFSNVLFRLLSHLHKQKTQRGVELMLSRLYEPILWRSLRVANSDVRLNAAALMFDVFPLQDPTLLNEQADAALQRQFDIMHALMTDPVPEVRVKAVLGVGNILNLYWELIPTQVIQCFVTTLIQDLVHDVTSSSVREAVIKVMFILCDNHLCIPLLKKILPELQDFVHDTSEKIRIAMFDLLLKVKGLRAVKFWTIVPVEHILARLEIDGPPIQRRIMKLIQSSFAPINQPPSQQVELCLTLIMSNRNAARQFFLNLPNSLGAVDTSKYILVLCRYALESSRQLLKAGGTRLQTEDKNKDEEDSDDTTVVKKSKVKRCHGKRKGLSTDGAPRDSDENVDNADTCDGVMETDSDSQESVTEKYRNDDSPSLAIGDVLSDVDLLSGLMEAVYLMFTVVSPQLSSPEHTVLKEGLSKKLSITLRELLNVSQNAHLDNALIALAGHLPSKALPMVSQKLIKRLKQVNQDPDQCCLAIKSLIQWGRAGDLFEMAQAALGKEFVEDAGGIHSRDHNAGTKKKMVAFTTETSELTFEQAANIVLTMLSLTECRLILKKKHRESLRSLVDGLKSVFLYLKSCLSCEEAATDAAKAQESKWDLALQAFSLYLRVAAFLRMTSAYGTEDDGRYWKCAMAFALELAIPRLQSTSDKETQKRASLLVENVIKVNNGLLMAGAYTPESLNQTIEICNSILKLQQTLPSTLIQSALLLVYQFTQLRVSSEATDRVVDERDDPPLPSADKEEIVLTCLTEALQSVSLLEDPGDQVVGATSSHCAIVKEIIQALTTPRTDPSVRERTLTVAADTLIKYLKSCSKRETIDFNCEKLPPFVSSLISTVKCKSTNRSSLIKELITHLESENVDIYSIHGITAIVPKLRLKDQKNPADSALEEALGKAVSQTTAGCMDEDVFRDLKLGVENQMKTWTVVDAESRQLES